ncbi:MAG: fibronectin type III domain-containing protein [Coprococcus sp.]
MMKQGKVRNTLKSSLAWILCIIMLFPLNVCASEAGTLDEQIADAQSELAEIKKQQNEAQSTYDRGTMGFIEWMLGKSDLTTKQKYDLNQAKTVLQNACEEDFSKWYGGDNTGLPEERNNMVTVLGDRRDAVSLENTKEIFWMLDEVNEIRANDENYIGAMKRNAAKTNFYFMAVAQTGADRGAGLTNHSSLIVSCENLSFGGSDPVAMWNSELSSFNEIKAEFGYSAITSQDQLAAVRERANEEGISIGHYTNLFWAVDQVMGIGYTNYGKYGNTGCFNAGTLSDYTSKYEVYTIAEFKKLFDEYYATVDPDVWQEKVDEAQAKLDSLLELRYEACTGHTFAEGEEKTATCTESGGTVYTCTKCGYKKVENEVPALGHSFTEGVCTRCGITGPKKINFIWWKTGPSSSSALYNQEFEVGSDIDISISYTSASEYKYDDEFVFDIADSSVMTYTAATNCTGTFHMNKIGETTVTIYPKVNPDMKNVITVSVTDVGGHDYTIMQAEPGTGITRKICSKCGFEKDVSIPTAITSTMWWQNGWGSSSISELEIGDSVNLDVSYTPTEVDNYEMVITSSDESILKVTEPDNTSYRQYEAKLDAVGTGDVTVRVALKYDPSVYREYALNVTEIGGHAYTAEIVTDEALASPATCTSPAKYYYSCDNCGRVDKESKKTFTVGDSLGHAYKPQYNWSENGNTCSLELVCEHDSNHKLSRSMSVSSSVQSATCESEGAKTCTATCTLYGQTYTDTKVIKTNPLGHAWEQGIQTKEPGCETTGTIQYKCRRCSVTKDEDVAAYGHEPAEAVQENVIPASCKASGSYDEVVYCSRCGDELSRESKVIPKTAHKICLIKSREATCAEAGNTEYYECELCKECYADEKGTQIIDKETVVIPVDKTNHTGETMVIDEKAPTCMDEGYSGDTVCKDCGFVLEKGHNIPICEHEYTKKQPDDMYLKNAADYSTPAEYYYVCQYCNKKGEESYYYGKALDKIDLKSSVIKLSENVYKYDGKKKTPDVSVSVNGKLLCKDTDYTVTYSSNINAGTAKVTVSGTGIYTGTRTVQFRIDKADNKINATTKEYEKKISSKVQTINLSKTIKATGGNVTYSSNNRYITVSQSGVVRISARYAGSAYITVKAQSSNYKTVQVNIHINVKPSIPNLTKVSSSSKATITAGWKRASLADGYQIQYSLSKKFEKGKYSVITQKGGSKTSVKISGLGKLKSGRKYYVRVRSYKMQSGTKKVSDWSKTITVKVK